jgi:transcriptional regulator with XRE-family HTH domain
MLIGSGHLTGWRSAKQGSDQVAYDGPAILRIPGQFWALPDVHQAVRTRDCQQLLKIVQRELGASQVVIATATGVDSTYVARIIRGERRPSKIDLLQRIADGLGMPDDLRAIFLGYPTGTTASPVVAPSTTPSTGSGQLDLLSLILAYPASPISGNTDEMRRRMFLTAATALAAQATLPFSLRAVTSRHSPDDWDAIAFEYGHRYLALPRAALLAELLPDLAALQLQIALADDTSRERLARPAALLAGLAAWACTHLGMARDARHSWLLAGHLAEDSHDHATAAWVQSQAIIAALYMDRPAAVIDRMVMDSSARHGGPVSSGAVQLLQGIAQVHAINGRPDKARAALRDADEMFDRLPVAFVKDASSYACPESRARHADAYVLARVGTLAEAEAAIARAVELYAPERVVSRAQLELHRAVALVRNGETDGAMHHAGRVLEATPTAARGQLVFSVARNVLDLVPVNSRHRPAVRAFHDDLVEMERVSTMELARG